MDCSETLQLGSPLEVGRVALQMTTYKVMTTMKASVMEEVPDERYSAAKRGGYSVAHLGPGSGTEQEMLETWLLLEVGLSPSWLGTVRCTVFNMTSADHLSGSSLAVAESLSPGLSWAQPENSPFTPVGLRAACLSTSIA